MLVTLITPSRNQWLFLVATLFIGLPVIEIVCFDTIYGLYMEHCVAPELHSLFGFAAGQVTVKGADSPAFCITSVVPGGYLDMAGFKPGDMPVFFHHNLFTEFYGRLRSAREGRAATIWVAACDSSGSPLQNVHAIAVPPPGQDAGRPR